jgi:hypothetical protein
MGAGFSYRGASGKGHAFQLFDRTNLKVLPWQGGLFALATYTPEPLYFGDAEILNGSVDTCVAWKKLEANGDDALVYILVENDVETRRAIFDDLIEWYKPPMN